MNHPFSLRGHGEICRAETRRERQRIFSTVGEHSVLPCRDIFAVPDTVLLHRRFTLRRARHSNAARFVSALLQTGSTRINCTKCLIRRCRALQRAKELRNTGMLRLRKLTHMCSRTLSDTANRLRNIRKKKSSVVLLFSKLSPVSGLRQAIK